MNIQFPSLPQLIHYDYLTKPLSNIIPKESEIIIRKMESKSILYFIDRIHTIERY